MLQRSSALLYALHPPTAPIVAPETLTPTRRIRVSPDDGVSEADQRWSAFLTCTTSGGGVATVDVALWHSPDGNTFVPLASGVFTQITTTGGHAEGIALDHEEPLFPYVRARIACAGGPPMNLTDIEIKLCANGLFTVV